MDPLSAIRDRGIKWVELQFMDVPGFIHCVVVSSKEVDEGCFRNGIGKLDGSSVAGLSEVSESDLNLIPDPETFAVLPWDSCGERTCRFICDVGATMGGGRHARDPRGAARRLEEHLADSGVEARVAAEVEFFIFDGFEVRVKGFEQVVKIRSAEAPEGPASYAYKFKGGYYIPLPIDTTYELRAEIARVLGESFGISVEAHHHEVAVGGQVEVNIRHDTLLRTADNILTLKYVAKRVAARRGRCVTFMPKPIPYDNGSGMHVHQSLWKDGENLFYDPSDEYAELSQLGRYYIGGLIEHGRSLSAIVSPTVNSYRRLIPGYEAPVYLVWSRGNRSAAIRVPVYRRGDRDKRVEFRPPDPSANPYLALTAIVAAGLDGIRRKIEPGDPVDRNVYHMSEAERRRLGIKELPRSLDEALDELESDHDYLKPYFGSDLIEAFIEVKREEVKRLASYPSPAEFIEYFNI